MQINYCSFYVYQNNYALEDRIFIDNFKITSGTLYTDATTVTVTDIVTNFITTTETAMNTETLTETVTNVVTTTESNSQDSENGTILTNVNMDLAFILLGFFFVIPIVRFRKR